MSEAYRGDYATMRAYTDHAVMYGLDARAGTLDSGFSFLSWYKPCDVSSGVQVIEPPDVEDEAVLADDKIAAHIASVSEAHKAARAGEEVDWESVIQEHILG